MKSFRDIKVWQKSMNLVTKTYEVTCRFPYSEQFGLTNQIRRCCISIPSNIAEGYGRKTNGELKRFLQISMGSIYEFQTQIEISRNINFINNEEFNNFINDTIEIEKMLKAFIKSIH